MVLSGKTMGTLNKNKNTAIQVISALLKEVFLWRLIQQKAIHFEPARLQIHTVFVHNPLLLLCGLQRHSVLDTFSSTR